MDLTVDTMLEQVTTLNIDHQEFTVCVLDEQGQVIPVKQDGFYLNIAKRQLVFTHA